MPVSDDINPIPNGTITSGPGLLCRWCIYRLEDPR